MTLLRIILLASAATPSMVDAVADSGRCVTLGETPSERISARAMVAPGPAPLLSFRYYEGRAHYRFGNLDLVVDDAGH
jgi:hypothetical protein